MDYELEYAKRMKALTMQEGHTGKLPIIVYKSQELSYKEDYDQILQILSSGPLAASSIQEITGKGRKFTNSRLQYLKEHGKITKQGIKWEIAK